ncbi:hypothetical protein L8106_04941 [Lyngbya sp. PCC 8106]|nr:hypothetical protein L8106_04941 [Lyngbya sp. PCC 8106]
MFKFPVVCYRHLINHVGLSLASFQVFRSELTAANQKTSPIQPQNLKTIKIYSFDRFVNLKLFDDKSKREQKNVKSLSQYRVKVFLALLLILEKLAIIN